MNFKYKVISIACFIHAFTLGAAEDLRSQNLIDSLLGSLGKSPLVHIYNEHVQMYISKLYKEILLLGDEQASEEYQKLGKEAQQSAGILENWHVPIKKINPASTVASFVGALAEADAIYVNEERLALRSYGARRCALFHEAVHEKYHDLAFDSILEWGSLISASIISHKLIKSVSPFNKFCLSGMVHKGGAFVLGVIASSLVSSKFSYYRERRADLEGHYGTACYKCVEESAAFARHRNEVEKNPLIHNGYLWPLELEEIAADLHQENKTCNYHREINA